MKECFFFTRFARSLILFQSGELFGDAVVGARPGTVGIPSPIFGEDLVKGNRHGTLQSPEA